MKLFKFLPLFLILFSFASCDWGTERRVTVTGRVGDILVVSDNSIWESDIKECLDTNLTQWIMPYLPDVATFELIHKTQNHFNQGVKRYRNILFIKIDPNYKGKKGSIKKRKDVWAKGQLVVDIVAKDREQLIKTCQYGLDEVHDAFDEMSWRRLIKSFKDNNSKNVQKELKKTFGLTMDFPSNAKVVTRRKNFYRIEFPPASRPIEFAGSGMEDVGNIFSGVMVYQYDFGDSTQFDLKQLLRDRDTVLKYNVPHEFEGLFMGTQYTKAVYPEGNWTYNASGSIKGFDMRGMFVFTGRAMASTGGAFWAFHFVHPKTKKLICLSGYVDAPSTTSWTHAIREIQAVTHSVEFTK